MLTKSDVKIISDLFDKKFNEKFENSFTKHTESIKEDIRQIRKDQKLIIRFFDNERIESYLKFPETN